LADFHQNSLLHSNLCPNTKTIHIAHFYFTILRHKNGEGINLNESVKVDKIKKGLGEINSDYGSCIPVAQHYPVVCVNTINFGFQYENVRNSKAKKQIHTAFHEKCSTLTKFI
jgi:hypothetical protein